MYRLRNYNGGLTEKGNHLNAKTAREHFSGKLEQNIGTVQKYLLKGLDEWIGDCDGMITHLFTSPQYDFILYLLNIRN